MRKALIVGIDNYPKPNELKGCVNDAYEFKSVVEVHANGSPNFAVEMKTNVSTKAELKKLIIELFTGDNDIALFYFSGHGFINSLGGYIVTPDFQNYDEGVSMDEILTIVNESEAKNKIIILDCCFSGAFGSPKISGGNNAFIKEGVTILTASKKNEPSLEVNGGGVFTGLLVDALQGGAADLRGCITPGAIYAYIDQALGPWDQRPVFKTNVTRFVSLRDVVPPVPIETLRKIVEYFPVPESQLQLDPTFEDTNEDICIEENTVIFKNLQRFRSVNLVVPVGEEHMYYAAQNSKLCRLTASGAHYWKLVKEKRI